MHECKDTYNIRYLQYILAYLHTYPKGPKDRIVIHECKDTYNILYLQYILSYLHTYPQGSKGPNNQIIARFRIVVM